jgi:hypothetical protein
VLGLRRTYHGPGNHLGHTRWYSLVTWVKWKLVSVRLEIGLISAQDRYMVCAECTTTKKSFLAHPMVLLGDVGPVEARFGPFKVVLISALDGCTVCVECSTGMEIILGTSDGTPK